jgi:hypothetical protein
MRMQAAWSSALLDPKRSVPANLIARNGTDLRQCFAVYRNNVIVSLMNTLADIFPVTQALVGESFFRAMAREFVWSHPPRSPVLAYYGRRFPNFVANFPPAATLPYLADVAQLELAHLTAFHAADTAPLDQKTLQGRIQQQEELSNLALLTLTLHPSLTALRSPYAIVSLWAAHQGHGDISTVDPYLPENAWVLRRKLAVRILPMSVGDCLFVSALQNHNSLIDAAENALSNDVSFDLARCLTILLREQAVSGIATAFFC